MSDDNEKQALDGLMAALASIEANKDDYRSRRDFMRYCDRAYGVFQRAWGR